MSGYDVKVIAVHEESRYFNQQVERSLRKYLDDGYEVQKMSDISMQTIKGEDSWGRPKEILCLAQTFVLSKTERKEKSD